MKRRPLPFKQVIVVRKDLNMDAGKLGGQTAHASQLALLGETRPVTGAPIKDELQFVIQGAGAEWLQSDFPKMVLEVHSEAELLEIYERAKTAGLPCGLVVDNGWTVFNNVKTPTTVAIGPAAAAAIDIITGNLKKYTQHEQVVR